MVIREVNNLKIYDDRVFSMSEFEVNSRWMSAINPSKIVTITNLIYVKSDELWILYDDSGRTFGKLYSVFQQHYYLIVEELTGNFIPIPEAKLE